MRRKIGKSQIFRHIVQFVLFFVLPGLYIMAFSELKTIYEMIIKGNFNFIQIFPQLIEFSVVFIITILLGRFFCGWLCAFGAFNDLIYEISKNVFKIKFKVNEKIDSVLKNVKYVILLLLVILVWTKGSTLLQGTSPWDAFAQITNFPAVLTDFTIGFILLALITVGAAFIERFFCRYLCPLGALFTIISKIGIFKISKPNEKCGTCRICTNNCSMGIPLYKVNSVKGGECINCLKCVEVCPRKNAQANILGENITPAMAGSVAIAAFTGIYVLSNMGSTILTNTGIASVNPITVNASNTSSSAKKYIDGTYTGSGSGFRGSTTTVSVTISSGKISNITTVSTGDTPNFYQNAQSTIFDELISTQSTSVDTVSGATFSSNGIIEAVKAALSKAI